MREGVHENEEAEAISVSVVVPVYQGERTLAALVDEIEPLTRAQRTRGGHLFRVRELIFVHDDAVDRSDVVMEQLASRHRFIRLIWLSRNFGQHPATLAGMASSTGDWIVTLDEDGQQNPAEIGALLDIAIESDASLVYAMPTNRPPHGRLRNAASSLAKWVFTRLLGNVMLGRFNSFRLIEGQIARSLAAFCGSEVYLDVALSWVVRKSAACPVLLREERGRPSGYTFRKLFSHMWRMFLTSGTKPLRLISILGCLSIVAGLAFSGVVVWERLTSSIPVQGWTSLVIALCIFSGLILFALGVIAEYVGLSLTMAMGKPLYLTINNRRASRKPPDAGP
jgi:undecaprenyl-phosphate 4-deoxy-4-formamido-L-arabinose transferase